MPSPTNSVKRSRSLSARAVILAALFLWLCVWTRFAWHAVQDDAFIHLRYADHLLRFHFITYDNIHQDFGTSSLLYVCLLALLRALTTSSELPHILSVVQHFVLFATCIVLFSAWIPRTARLARTLALLTLVLIVTPSGVRWFQDGMETGLTCLVSILLVATVWRFGRLRTFRPIHYATLFTLGLLLVFHRMELGMPIAVAFLILTTARRNQTTLIRSALDASPLLIGAAVSALGIILTMHAFLPDTALAKSAGHPEWMAAINNTAIILRGGMSIGAGLALFWLLTLVILLRAGRLTLPTLLANSIFPITLFLAGLRGQQIQGARYLMWTFLASITWNILELGHTQPENETPDRPTKILLYTFATLLILGLPVESYIMHNMLTGRAATARIFQAQHLERLRQYQGAAYEVGYIGYFTQAPLCDLAGLVNGRAAAALSPEQRGARCGALHPDFVFGDFNQVAYQAQYQSFHGWLLCGSYDLYNVRGPARHFLFASPAAAPTVCAAAAGAAQEPPPEFATYVSAASR